ncbi:MAG: hypothetical protein SOW25_01645 [Helicobacter sp.]|nr:hypothetical protein [Helicobacteraceae bacterium]MDY3113015.1 hypothetical protein [Helicobacter sp.]
MEISNYISILSALIAIVSCIWAFKSSKEAKAQREINQGLQAMEIWKNIAANKDKIFYHHEKLLSIQNFMQARLVANMIESIYEDSRNFYELLAYSYLESYIDKDFFKEMYKNQIIDFVESEINKRFYAKPHSNYKYTLKVYNEFKI